MEPLNGHDHRELEASLIPGVGYENYIVSLFVVQLIVILSICRILTVIGQYFLQPRVIMEIIGGIVLGPTLMGQSDYFLNSVFPESSLHALEIIADFGLVLYLFVVGLELDLHYFAQDITRSGSIAIVCMFLPFALGVAISPLLYEVMEPEVSEMSATAKTQERYVAFLVFIGTALAITAFPVLARILKETGLEFTVAGSTAMGAAAINDGIAWVLLTLAVSLSNSSGDPLAALWLLLAMLAYGVVLFTVGYFLFRKFIFFFESGNGLGNRRETDQNLFVITVMLLLLSAWFTSMLGMDAIIGSFMFGLIVPRDSRNYKFCIEHMEGILSTFFLPLYFAKSGLKTDLTSLKPHPDILITILIIVAATVGKTLGAAIPAYLSGFSVKECTVVAFLMNTRGLMELVVLNIGYQAGVLHQRVFSAMVIMCIVTTLMSFPLCQLIYPVEQQKLAKDQATGPVVPEHDQGIEMQVFEDGEGDEDGQKGGEERKEDGSAAVGEEREDKPRPILRSINGDGQQ